MTHRLPGAWLETTIDKLFRTTGGGTPATGRSEFWGNGVAWITSADIDEGGDISPRKAVTQSGIASSATNPVPPGSVVVVTRVGLGKVALATQELCFSQDCQALLFNPQLLDPPFVAHQIRRTVRGIRGRGTTIAGVTVKQLGALPFSLAPLREQHRIVEAIDSYLTRLDDAVASLERAQVKLKAYRASVLKAAVEGRLVQTEASLARAETRAYESAEVLLTRILKERRRRWDDAQLAKLSAAGTTLKDDRWKMKYQEPVALVTSALSKLPEGWCWATVDMVADVGTGATPTRGVSTYWDDGTIPWVTSAAAVQRVVLESSELVTELAVKKMRLRVYPPGTLILALYGEGQTRGRCSVLGIAATTNQALASLVTNDTAAQLREWLRLFMHFNYENLRRQSSGGVQPNLNLSIVKRISIPLPPLGEQQRLVAEWERLLSVEQALAADLRTQILRIARLRQCILKWAFEGKLVDQDPTDEPAESLLTRIRAERAAVAPPKSSGRRARGAA